MVLFWFGYGLGPGLWFRYGFRYDFDMVWERSGLFGAPDGLVWKQKTETTQGTGLWSISCAFFLMVLIWIWYGFDTIVTGFWYDSDMIWIWFEEGNRFFWGFLMGWLEKKTRNNPGTGFWSLSPRLFGFGMILIGLVLIQSWYDAEMLLIWFWSTCVQDAFKKTTKTSKKHTSQFWSPSKITTETISKPYCNWNHIKIIAAKTGHQQIITRNHIWIISKSQNNYSILKRLYPRASWR